MTSEYNSIDISSNLNGDNKIIEEINKELPDEVKNLEINNHPEVKYSIHRNLNYSTMSTEFMPDDLITLKLENTGDWKLSSVKMIDNREQNRYFASSGGNIHTWTTRIQKTKSFGEWKFIIDYPSNNEKRMINLEIPFEIVKFLPEQIITEEDIVSEITEETLIYPYDDTIVKIPVIEIKGVGPSYSNRLNNANIKYFHELINTSQEKLIEISNATPVKVNNWTEFVKSVLDDKNNQLVLKYQQVKGDGEVDLLPSTIKGIGPATEKKLIQNGINNITQLANSKPEKIASVLNKKMSRVIPWINEARIKLSIEPIKTPKTISKKRVTKKSQSDVTRIKGIGSKKALKLAGAGYTNIKSIANADPIEMAQKTNETQSKTNNWISQAKLLIDGKVIHKKQIKITTDLRSIRGIGPTYQNRLNTNGINNINDFIRLSIDDIASICKVNKIKAKLWFDDAIKLSRTL